MQPIAFRDVALSGWAASLHGLHLYWARQAEQILASYADSTFGR